MRAQHVPSQQTWLAFLLIAAGATIAAADQMTMTSYATSFEPESGYVVGLLAPDVDPLYNQPGGANLWENSLDTWAREGVVVTTERAHSGTQAIKFVGNPDDPEDPHSSAQHITILDADPCDPNTGEWRPVVWQEEFWIYVPWEIPNGAWVLRAEPWSNWIRLCGEPFGQPEGFSYQFFIWRVDDGLADGWYPQIGIDAQANDLRDEMGMDPLFDSFATDTWWKVTIVADGSIYQVNSVTINDDLGNTFVADGLTDCFSSWGEPCPGEGGDNYCSRAERAYYLAREGVYLDDLSLFVVGEEECPEDLNGDGQVDLADLTILLAAYGACTGDPNYNPVADIDDSGCVDLADLNQLLAAYGTSC
jgi:hypothetical protein